MNCPNCNQASRVLKTIGNNRWRECTACKHRFATTEVLKDDHRRQEQAVRAVLEVAERIKTAA